MRAIYRPHRGSLADAMRETRVFESVEEMKEYICATSSYRALFADGFEKLVRAFTPDDIVLGEETLNDERTGWEDTRYVCVKRYFDEMYDIPQCIGMCATVFPDNTSHEQKGEGMG